MADHKNETLSGNITVDGKVFDNVTFREATILYDGGIPPHFLNCAFEATSFNFREQAANTIIFLRAMAPASSGMRSIVEGLVPEMKA